MGSGGVRRLCAFVQTLPSTRRLATMTVARCLLGLGLLVAIGCKPAPSPADGASAPAPGPSVALAVVTVPASASASVASLPKEPEPSAVVLVRVREEIAFRVEAGFDSPSAIVGLALAAVGTDAEPPPSRAFVEREVLARLAEHTRAEETWKGPTVAERIERAFTKLERDGVFVVAFVGKSQDDANEIVRERAEAAKKAGKPIRGYAYFTQGDLKAALVSHSLLVFSSSLSTNDAAYRAVVELVISRLRESGLKVDWPFQNPAYVPSITGVEWKKRRGGGGDASVAR